MVEWRFSCSLGTSVQGLCVELWFCGYSDWGWSNFTDLTLIDECTRECLALKVARKLNSQDVLEQLGYLFIYRELPGFIRSDNGPEFTAKAVRNWLERLGVQTLFIEPGSPWENGYNESFNGKLRDELLKGEIFITLLEPKVLIENRRKEYNQFRPHSSLGYRPPSTRGCQACESGNTNLKSGTT